MPAVVQGFNAQTDTYVLDIQPVAIKAKVRPRPDASAASAQSASAQPLPQKSRSHVQRPCALCSVPFAVEQLLGPECDHMFCQPCLRGHCLKVDFLRQKVQCPLSTSGCATQLSSLQVRTAVGEETFAQRQLAMEKKDEELARKLIEGEERTQQQGHFQQAPRQGEMPRQSELQQRRSWEQEVGSKNPSNPFAAGACQAHSGGYQAGNPFLQPSAKPPQPDIPAFNGHALGGSVRPAAAECSGSDNKPSESGQSLSWVRAELMKGAATTCGLCSVGANGTVLLGPPCGHLFCGACLSQHAKANDFVSKPVLCPTLGCKTEISTEQVRHVVGEATFVQRHREVDEKAARALQDQFMRLQADEVAHDARRHEFECPLCFDKGLPDDAIALDCDHRLCHECFKNYLESKISEAQVAEDELVCPIPNCKTEITVPQIEGATFRTPLWDKFLQFRMNMWRPGSGSNIVECPTLNCGKFVVPIDFKFVTCPVCNKEFCPKCSGPKHEDVSCEDYAAWVRQNEGVDTYFEELMAKEQWRRCPVCSAPSERESGCNFMQCRSERCRKRTYWCYVCGKQMPKEEHYQHYPKGPYEDLCNTPEHDRLPMPGKPDVAPVGGQVTAVVGQMFGVLQRKD